MFPTQIFYGGTIFQVYEASPPLAEYEYGCVKPHNAKPHVILQLSYSARVSQLLAMEDMMH